jgi:hypothetical protein
MTKKDFDNLRVDTKSVEAELPFSNSRDSRDSSEDSEYNASSAAVWSARPVLTASHLSTLRGVL